MKARVERVAKRLGWVALLAIAGLEALITAWALFAVFGLVPPPTFGGQPMSAPDLASLAVAGGTLILATATVLLALLTRRSLELGRTELTLAEATLKQSGEQVAATLEQVKVTHDQAEVARQTLESSWRPFLVDVPLGYAPGNDMGITDAAVVSAYKRADTGGAYVAVSLRNIGSGLAIIKWARLSFGELHETATSFSSSIVAASEVVRIRFEIRPEGAVVKNMVSQVEAKRPFEVTVVYTDQAGRNKWRSRAYFKWQQQFGRPEAEKVELFSGEDITPFAWTGETQ